jgi:hypothetical protein
VLADHLQRIGALLLAAFAVAAVLASAGCTSNTVEKDSPETLARLADYERAIADKDTLIKQLTARVTELDEAVVIKLQAPEADGAPGPIVEIIGRGPHARTSGAAAIGEPPRADVEVYKAFVARVDGSHGEMRKCYEVALKRDSALQARAVTVTVRVKFYSTGKVASATFAPSISPEFIRCAQAAARSWSLDRLPEAISVEYQIRLAPQ